jgi:hypothetical protein
MNVGDIVLYQGARWKVVSHEPSFRTCQLVQFNGTKVEVPDDEDLKVLFNPAKSWPFVAGPVHARSGPLIGVLRGALSLGPLVDWVPSDFLRPGGSIFFNPELRLRQGEILVGLHKDGTRSRISITKAFGTVRLRKHRVANPLKAKGPKSSFDRLMSDDLFNED